MTTNLHRLSRAAAEQDRQLSWTDDQEPSSIGDKKTTPEFAGIRRLREAVGMFF